MCMELKIITDKLTVCKVADIAVIDMSAEFYFIGKTDEELSLVCKTEDVPLKTIERDDGWRGFRKTRSSVMTAGEDSAFRVYLIFR